MPTNISGSEFLLLHGEDDMPDIDFIKRTLKGMDYSGTYRSFSMGQEILDWVLKEGVYLKNIDPLPNLILLDIGLPGINGKEILKILRANDPTKHIPVVIMSGSVSERDFHECIVLGCNGYIQKNESLEQVTETCRLLINSWMKMSCQNFI